MSNKKFVKDIMFEIFEYPHIPYWFNIEQVIKVIKAFFIQTQKYTEPLVVLVFDEKYNLLGTVTPRDVLKKLKLSLPIEINKEEPMVWDSFFSQEIKKIIHKPVSEIMVPAKHFVEPSDPVIKAAYLMISYDLAVLPVIREKKKLLGLVRIIEVFDVISEELLKNRSNFY
ncbi:MAG: CBS domain-containing protein [Thermodesulfovibrio sp.]|nr:CBS domain-containing protein [Thermodesulfovibrio sp.]